MEEDGFVYITLWRSELQQSLAWQVGTEVSKKNTAFIFTSFLPAVLYWCKTWSATRREEHGLRVFDNKTLRKISRSKRDNVIREWKKLRNEDLYALYSSPNIIRVTKSRRMRWTGHAARMVHRRCAYRVFVGKETTWKTYEQMEG